MRAGRPGVRKKPFVTAIVNILDVGSDFLNHLIVHEVRHQGALPDHNSSRMPEFTWNNDRSISANFRSASFANCSRSLGCRS